MVSHSQVTRETHFHKYAKPHNKIQCLPKYQTLNKPKSRTPNSIVNGRQFVREMIDQGNKNAYENELKFGYGMNQMDTGVLPMYVPSVLTDPIPPADSGLTTLPISRKRSRDLCSVDPAVLSFPNGQFVNLNGLNNNGIFTFLGNNISMQIYQQQLEIDQFVAQHTEKMRSEIEATRRRNTMRLIAFADEGINRLRSKEDEIVKIGRLNSALEEKVKSLSVDNQIWQQMAQTNEATANVLRRNLHQILIQIQQQNNAGRVTGESCCGSNYDGESHHRRTLGELNIQNGGNDGDARSGDNNGRLKRWCRNCGKEELCVLLLPCRHLCVCTACESSINVCPICKSTKNASLHVNMNSF
ncbi:hypothetical protein L1987_85275 [Smallanthus sonchifolius]|uniref:Uncharacterized protein n=1 Tax=Smallanthus sonchifolius TaxID=185202 RepID=A0ACB8XW31_9ASTR|nr:hypothetical protein L1987_85275 [Smallanthus sonchifolius]